MTRKNVDIVREYVEQVINTHRLDRMYDYIREDCVMHNPPYVGLGFRSEEKPDNKLVITQIAEHGPCFGLLQVGDELVRIQDAHSVGETFEQLKNGFYGRGCIGELVTITVRRNGQLLDFNLVRSRIEGFNLTMKELFESFQKFMRDEMPDFKTEINLIFEAGDKVAFFETASGTSKEFHTSAIWTACNILRLETGKIVEWWSVEDTMSLALQEGYQVKEPMKEAV